MHTEDAHYKLIAALDAADAAVAELKAQQTVLSDEANESNIDSTMQALYDARGFAEDIVP